jgi:hypothetical protein
VDRRAYVSGRIPANMDVITLYSGTSAAMLTLYGMSPPAAAAAQLYGVGVSVSRIPLLQIAASPLRIFIATELRRRRSKAELTVDPRVSTAHASNWSLFDRAQLLRESIYNLELWMGCHQHSL